MNRPDAEYFTDGELQEAARKVRQAMLESLPEEDKVPHHFSPAFQEKMGPLLKKAQRMERTRTWKRRTAAAVLVFLLGTGAWLAGDSGARAAVLSWVREVYENSVLYRFFNQGAGLDSLPALRPSWLPEGYQKADEITEDTAQLVVYQHPDQHSPSIIFDYCLMSADIQTELLWPESEYESISMQVGSCPAQFYRAQDDSMTNNLVWFDEDGGLMFTLSASLDLDVMLHIAESVNLEE